jgi:hypothetical protein
MEEAVSYNSGGRPRKDPADKRSVKKQTHFTPDEAAEIEINCALAGMTEAEFLRKLALDQEVSAQANPEELKKIRAELGKIGSNINQIAKAVNQGKKFDEARFEKMSHWLVQTLEKL